MKVDVVGLSVDSSASSRSHPTSYTVEEGSFYVDPMLPFGLRSAPKIFNAVADALNWYMIQLGIRNVLHYLDDFIVIGPPNSPECGSALPLLKRTCEELKVPLACHKREAPQHARLFWVLASIQLPGK